MKIAIFENEYDTVEMAFKYMNKKFYGNAIQFDNYPSSDSYQNIASLTDYNLIIIDLDLSAQSTLDGFGLIRIIEQSIQEPPKILILTGQNLGEKYDIENGLKKKYPVLEKPINFKKLYAKFIELGI